MSDAYDWEKDDAYMLRKFCNDEINEDRECDCGWQGLVLIEVFGDTWVWDCPQCASEIHETAEVLSPKE